jgi:glutathione-regulated potassium-efflux system ancillary protein KefG
MKTVVVIAHPNLQQSRINRRLMEVTQAYGIQTYNLYDKYPDEKIDVADEQKILEGAERIVLQFPFYWYSAPSLMKKWIDSVMTHGWAYGTEGNSLREKPLLIAISTGGPADAYSPEGYNKYPIEDLLLPYRAMANLTKMVYQPPFVISGVRTLSDEALNSETERYLELLIEE